MRVKGERERGKEGEGERETERDRDRERDRERGTEREEQTVHTYTLYNNTKVNCCIIVSDTCTCTYKVIPVIIIISYTKVTSH